MGVPDLGEDPTATSSASPGSAPSPANTESTIGEFNAFSVLGASLTSGGGAKRGIWLSDEEVLEKPCLGLIGSGDKICIKRRVGSAISCGTTKHEGTKFRVPSATGFIRCSDSQILCEPTLNVSEFDVSQLKDLKALRLGTSDWMAFFASAVKVQESPKDSKMKEPESSTGKDPGVSSELQSPRLSDRNTGIFALVPSLSFDSVDSAATASSHDIRALEENKTVLQRLKSVEAKLKTIKQAWSKPFMEIDACYLSVVNDLKLLGKRTTWMSETLETPVELLGKNFPSLWQGFKEVDGVLGEVQRTCSEYTAKTAAQLAEINRAKVDIGYLHESQGSFEDRLTGVETTLQMHNGRFAKLRPIIEQWLAGKRSMTGSPSAASGLEARLNKLEEVAKQADWMSLEGDTLSAMRDQIMMLESLVKDQAASISVLENRVVGSGVQMGEFVFQSFEDLHTWTRRHMPPGRFGFIVDAHSFLEFFTLAGHIDTEVVAAAEHNAEKAGYATFYEMKVGASFSNLFPLIFGKPGSGSESVTGLPGVSTGEKWIHPTTGVHAQVMRKMNDISYQFDMNIRQVYRDHPEAKKLATDCVTASKRFIIDFFNFISSEYQVWQQRGFSKKDAWEIMSQIVRRIFEDLETSRISARHSRDKNNMEFTTTTIVMATLRCHHIMNQYVEHQFHEHPAISSVITRHIAANFIKPETTPDSKFADLDKKVKGLSTKVDQLDTRVSKLEKNGK